MSGCPCTNTLFRQSALCLAGLKSWRAYILPSVNTRMTECTAELLLNGSKCFQLGRALLPEHPKEGLCSLQSIHAFLFVLPHTVTLQCCCALQGGLQRAAEGHHCSVCPCSSPCQEVLLWFLEKSERQTSLWVLEGCVGLASSVHRLHPQCRFRMGSEGGAAIVAEEPVR